MTRASAVIHEWRSSAVAASTSSPVLPSPAKVGNVTVSPGAGEDVSIAGPLSMKSEHPLIVRTTATTTPRPAGVQRAEEVRRGGVIRQARSWSPLTARSKSRVCNTSSAAPESEPAETTQSSSILLMKPTMRPSLTTRYVFSERRSTRPSAGILAVRGGTGNGMRLLPSLATVSNG
ncbi:hypothetical protein ACFPRL_13140 [Pseudoclavibacter helvolus]